jgi:hypothetical protein
LIQYPDFQEANNAYESFNKFYLKNGDIEKNKIIETEDGKLVGMDLEKNHFILVFEGKDKREILQLLDSVKKSLK